MVSWKEFSDYEKINEQFFNKKLDKPNYLLQIKAIREWAFGRLQELQKKLKYAKNNLNEVQEVRIKGQIEVFKELTLGEQEQAGNEK